MTISSASSVPNTTPVDPLKPVGSKELNRDDFMTLFITQLQFQDPMKPMDSYEMASQLAQFSSMEASMKMSDTLTKMLDYQTSQNNLQLISILNQEVQTVGNQIGVVEGTASTTEFTLAVPADRCVIEIYDSEKRLVQTIDQGELAAGTYELNWDGKDSRGGDVKDGAYSYVVKAIDPEGNEVEVDYRTTGTVTGLEFTDGSAKAVLDKYVTVSVGDVVRVQQPSRPADAGGN